jgi:phosphoribosylformylglycinamidine synthase
MQAAVIIFPGSNCDRDMITAIGAVTGNTPKQIWHGETSIPDGIDLIVLPGGFSYGDYLRCGAISAKSPIMQEVAKAAEKGTYILGVCNGFQVLTESHLLPGTLIRNQNIKFICKDTELTIANTDSAFTKKYAEKSSITIPVAHHDGNYVIDNDGLKSLQDNGQIAFQYAQNPNGSINNIAGVMSNNKRILGMMPHPERACDSLTGGTDGILLFESMVEQMA